MQNSTASSSVRPSSIAATPNPVPSEFVAESLPGLMIGHRLLRQKAEDIIGRIMAHNYAFPIRYPSQKEIVRTAPAKMLRANGWYTLFDPATGEVYLVSPSVWRQTSSQFVDTYCVPIGFALTASHNGQSFLWPYLANYNGDLAAETAIEKARDGWVRVTVDKPSGSYTVESQTGYFPEPTWPSLEHDNVIDIVFGEREICSMGHAVMTRVWGKDAT